MTNAYSLALAILRAAGIPTDRPIHAVTFSQEAEEPATITVEYLVVDVEDADEIRLDPVVFRQVES